MAKTVQCDKMRILPACHLASLECLTTSIRSYSDNSDIPVNFQVVHNLLQFTEEIVCHLAFTRCIVNTDDMVLSPIYLVYI